MPASPAPAPRRTGATPFPRLGGALLAAAGALLCLPVLLRAQLGSGFRMVTGDIYDGRIEVSLLGHWVQVLRGAEPWNRTGFFFSHPDTLGYNDGFLLFGLPFALLRWLGVEPMLASDLVNLLVRGVGYAGFVLMAIELAGLPLLPAVLGAVLFTLCNGAFMQEGHQQLLAVCFAPVLFVLLNRGRVSLRARRPVRAAGFGMAAALLFGAWALTGFYMLWFTVLFSAIALPLLLAQRDGRRAVREGWRDETGKGLAGSWPVWLSLGALALALLPFLRVYLPTAAETGQHAVTDVLPGLAHPADLLRLGPDSLLFGWLEPLLDLGLAAPRGGEWIVGFSPVLWLCALGGAAAAFGRGAWPAALAPRPLWRALALATLVCLILCQDLGGGAPWRAVYALVPGAAAIRQETRLLLFLDLPMVLLAMLGLALLPRRRWPVAAGLALLLVAGEINLGGAQHLDRTEEAAALRAIPAAPADCRVFVVSSRGHQPTVGSPEVDALYHHTVDAMMLAEQRGLLTLNGYATFTPPDVLRINRLPVRPGVIRADARDRGISGPICGLDLDRDRWIDPLPPAPPLPPDGLRFDGPAPNAEPFLAEGWGHAEPNGRWTVGNSAGLEMTLPDGFADRLLGLTVSALPLFPPRQPASAVWVMANGRVVTRWAPLPGQVRFTATLPRHLPGLPSLLLQFVVETPTTPRSINGAADDRALGLQFRALTLAPLP